MKATLVKSYAHTKISNIVTVANIIDVSVTKYEHKDNHPCWQDTLKLTGMNPGRPKQYVVPKKTEGPSLHLLAFSLPLLVTLVKPQPVPLPLLTVS